VDIPGKIVKPKKFDKMARAENPHGRTRPRSRETAANKINQAICSQMFAREKDP